MAAMPLMRELQVKKVVAVCFLEAAKLTLEQLGAYRLELSQKGVQGRDELPRLYGEVRRLRDYLQRCVSGYRDIVVLELGEEDASLLVATCRRSVEAIAVRLEERALAPDERQWLTKKLQVLSDWSVELAAKPVIDLPLPRLGEATAEAVRTLNTRIQDKVYGDVTMRQKFSAPNTGRSPGVAPSSAAGGRGPSLAQGIATFGEHMAGERKLSETDAPLPQEPPPSEPSPPVQEAPPRPPASQPEPVAVDHRQRPAAPAHEDEPPAVLAPLLDPKKVRDPRLRSLVAIDLGTFESAQRDRDFRIATVMLASIMESALLDHAIPRRSELGLSGKPDSWNMKELLLKAMGDAVHPKDHSLAFHLFAARNLLRPALQMVAPAVVTASSFDRMRDFVSRAIHAIGFGAQVETLPPGSVPADQIPAS